MKVLIGLALLSVAFATPLMPPLTLPEAPLPAMESVELPPPELPAIETLEAHPVFQTPDIRPAMIPQFIIDELNKLQNQDDAPIDVVRVVEIAEQEVPSSLQDKAAPEEEAISSVIVVEHETAPLEVIPAETEDQVDPVRVVDGPVEPVSEDRQVSEPIIKDSLTEIKADPVIVVDNVDVPIVHNVEVPSLPEITADPVIVVDNAEVPVIVKRDTLLFKAEPVTVDRVIVVDSLDLIPETEIIADAVRVVDIAPTIVSAAEVLNVAHLPVVLAPYPVKYYDNPLLR